MSGDEGRQVVTYKIPKLETYEVADHELERIEESCSSVSQDLTFAVASLSICLTLLAALLSATFTETAQTLFLVIAVVSAFVSIYTGARWYRTQQLHMAFSRRYGAERSTPNPLVRTETARTGAAIGSWGQQAHASGWPIRTLCLSRWSVGKDRPAR